MCKSQGLSPAVKLRQEQISFSGIKGQATRKSSESVQVLDSLHKTSEEDHGGSKETPVGYGSSRTEVIWLWHLSLLCLFQRTNQNHLLIEKERVGHSGHHWLVRYLMVVESH